MAAHRLLYSLNSAAGLSKTLAYLLEEVFLASVRLERCSRLGRVLLKFKLVSAELAIPLDETQEVLKVNQVVILRCK